MAGRFSLEAVFFGRDNMSKIIAKIEGNAGRMARTVSGGLGDMAKINDKLIGKFGELGKKIIETGIAIAGIAGVVGLEKQIEEGAHFEAAISDLGSVTMRTSDLLGELSEKAEELGSKGKFTATELAGAMTMMQRASMTDEQIIESIDNIAAAAKIDGAEVVDTSKQIVGAVKAMGLAGPEMGKHVNEMADMLAVARNHSTASMSDITAAIDSVAPVARQLNIPLSQVMASIVGLTAAGLDAGSAGQAMSTMFIKLSKLSPQLQAQLTAMKVKFTDAHGEMLPMPEVLAAIAKRMSKAGGNFKEMGKLAEMVGGKGTKAALALEQFFKSGDMEKLTEALENSAGAAKKVAAIRGDNLLGDITKLIARVRGFMESLYKLEGGPLRRVTKGITAWVDANKDLVRGKVTDYVNWFVSHLPQIEYWLGKTWRAVKVLAGASLTFKMLTMAVGIFNAACAANPWVLIAAAILAWGVLLYTFWPEITAMFRSVWNGILGYFMGIWNSITSAFSQGFFQGLFETWKQAFLLFNPIVWIGKSLNQLSKWLFGMSLADAAGHLIDSIKAGFASAWSAILDSASGFMTSLLQKLHLPDWVMKLLGVQPGGGGDGDSPDAGGGAGAPEVVSPEQRGGFYSSETNNNTTNRTEVVVTPGGGSTAAFRRPPPTGTPIRIQPSGAM